MCDFGIGKGVRRRHGSTVGTILLSAMEGWRGGNSVNRAPRDEAGVTKISNCALQALASCVMTGSRGGEKSRPA